MNELDLCPFCGNQAHLVENQDGTFSVYHVNSLHCPAKYSYMSKFDSKNSAVDFWNSRFKIEKKFSLWQEPSGEYLDSTSRYRS